MIGGINKKYLYFGLLFCLTIISAIISSSFSRDSYAYNQAFNIYGASGWGALTTEVFYRELFFLIVSKVSYQLGLSTFFPFVIFSAVSLSVKLYLIGSFSKDRLLSLSFYISYFFILHDSTQIRFGIAISFVYLGLYFLANNRKLMFSVIVIFSALMFHMTSLVFMIMLLFSTRKSLYWALGLVALSIFLYPVNLNDFLLSFLGEVISYFEAYNTFLSRLNVYLERPSADIFLGMFSRSAMLVYLCAIVIFQYRDKFSTYEILCYNAFILSIFFYILLKDTVDLQVRFRDLFGFSLVFLIPFIHRCLSVYIGNRNAYIILYLYLGVHLIKFAIYDKMLIL